MNILEDLLERHIIEKGLTKYEREFRFDKIRRWRFDFAWPELKVAVEVDSGIYCRGRHVRGSGFERDANKRNAAVMARWRVLHFTPRQVWRGEAIQVIEALLNDARAAKEEAAR